MDSGKKKLILLGTIAVIFLFFASTYLKNWDATIAEKTTEDLTPKVKAAIRDFKTARNECPKLVKRLQESIASLGKKESVIKKLKATKLIAECQMAARQYDSAAEYYGKLAEAEPQVARWHGLMTEALFNSGRYEEAIRIGRLAVQLDPKEYQWRRQEARILAKLGLFKRADKAFQAAIKIAPYEEIERIKAEYARFLDSIQSEAGI